jgi:hypothetical protein
VSFLFCVNILTFIGAEEMCQSAHRLTAPPDSRPLSSVIHLPNVNWHFSPDSFSFVFFVLWVEIFPGLIFQVILVSKGEDTYIGI